VNQPLSVSTGLWERRLTGSLGLCTAFLWGFAEATFFFIIPDVFLSLVAVFHWRGAWRHILCAMLGAVFGGALLYSWAAAQPAQARESILRVPFVRPEMLDRVDTGFRTIGLSALPVGSVTGVPYKLYAIEAPRFCGMKSFLLATPLARGVRFVLVTLIFGLVAGLLRHRLGVRNRNLLLLYAAAWIVTYAFYWGRILLQ
jgi:membrane protein YqaA with SNARE-associated domain